MTGLISKQDAINAVSEYALTHTDLDADKLNGLVKVIMKLPEPQRWISCNDKLPPYGEHVLTWWKGVIAIDCRVPCYEEEWLLNVEAWMPLPEPYAERR